MKMKAFFSSTVIFALLLFCCGLNQVQAQAKTSAAQSKTTTSSTFDIPFCDAVLPNFNKQLQTDANATCTTQTTCVECLDRASKTVVSATLYVQPDKADCKGATEITYIDDDAKSRGTKPAPRFRPKLLQNTCFASGTNLEVVVPGYDMSKRQFGYLWEVDGKKAGHLPTVQCACGKEAKVRVTYLQTGESVSLSIKLNSTCGSSSSN